MKIWQLSKNLQTLQGRYDYSTGDNAGPSTESGFYEADKISGTRRRIVGIFMEGGA